MRNIFSKGRSSPKVLHTKSHVIYVKTADIKIDLRRHVRAAKKIKSDLKVKLISLFRGASNVPQTRNFEQQ